MKGLTWAFSWLKVAATAFKTLLRHYAKWTLTLWLSRCKIGSPTHLTFIIREGVNPKKVTFVTSSSDRARDISNQIMDDDKGSS